MCQIYREPKGTYGDHPWKDASLRQLINIYYYYYYHLILYIYIYIVCYMDFSNDVSVASGGDQDVTTTGIANVLWESFHYYKLPSCITL
jgi:hypothetical protein